jgi:acetolactate synthase-1/2/3 large subunit
METAARRKTNSPTYSTAYFFLEGLSELGIEYLFCNFGTDHAPIIEEIAHGGSAATRFPPSSPVRTRTPPPTWRRATPS